MTAVDPAHRGHRLGLLIKVDMLELLAGREPQVRFVQTWNGETNAHMVAINEALGFGDPRRGHRVAAADPGPGRGGSVVEAQAAQFLGAALPVLGHLDAQVEIDPGAQQGLDLRAGPGCRRPSGARPWSR